MTPQFETRLATSAEDLRAAQALRYEVFVAELGGDGPLVDHDARLERDRFDPHFDHLLLLDHARSDAPVVGVYRMMRHAQAVAAGGFYSEAEYNLSPLIATGRPLLELGRSCVHPDYRGGVALMHLWAALARYVADHGIEVLFGVASFHGTDIAALRAPLSLLHHRHLAPANLRVSAQGPGAQSMDLLPEAQIDRAQAMRAVPALIKSYLRLGGFVGQGAYVDHAFNTTDVCLVLDTRLMSEKQRALYAKGPPA